MVTGEVAWTGPTGVGVRFNQNSGIGQLGTQDSLGAVPPQQPEATDPVAFQARSGRTIDMPGRRRADVPYAALSTWAAILALVICRVEADTNARIQALTDEVNRSSQAWTRIEAAIANRLEPARVPVSGETRAVPPSPTPTPLPAEAPKVTDMRPAPVTIPSSSGPSVERPHPTPATDRASGPETVYVVQEGDTLFRIGLRFNLSSKALMDYNNLAEENIIFVGQRIRIPADGLK
jgi:LysM repeat protein